MSKIAQFGRQFEVFDATSKKHRELFFNALKHRTWGRSPIRFWVDDEQTDLMYQCTRKIADYYMKKEFGKISIDTGIEVPYTNNNSLDAVENKEKQNEFHNFDSYAE